MTPDNKTSAVSTSRKWEAVVNFKQYLNGAPQNIAYTGECDCGGQVGLHDVFLHLACRLALQSNDAAHIESLEVRIGAPQLSENSK